MVSEDNMNLDKLLATNYAKTSAYGLAEAMEQMSIVTEALRTL